MRKWTPGTADEAWKVIICARDYLMAKDVLEGLIHILADPREGDGIAAVRQMTGAQIVDGILKYAASAEQSVRNGLKKETA